mmetsp:Transcript_73112/g.202777  ORF Transcript_73112/g.202777 Transcript_73112/m.202777 type:complete len:225 (+) Transcript_73112:2-676(+)
MRTSSSSISTPSADIAACNSWASIAPESSMSAASNASRTAKTSSSVRSKFKAYFASSVNSASGGAASNTGAATSGAILATGAGVNTFGAVILATINGPSEASSMPGTIFTFSTTVDAIEVEVLTFSRTSPTETPTGGLMVASTTTDPAESFNSTCSGRIPGPASAATASFTLDSKFASFSLSPESCSKLKFSTVNENDTCSTSTTLASGSAATCSSGCATCATS